MRVKTITKEAQFHMTKERYNPYQVGVGVKTSTPKHPTRNKLKRDLRKMLGE